MVKSVEHRQSNREAHLGLDIVSQILITPRRWDITVIPNRLKLHIRRPKHLRIPQGILARPGIQETRIDAGQHDSSTLTIRR